MGWDGEVFHICLDQTWTKLIDFTATFLANSIHCPPQPCSVVQHAQPGQDPHIVLGASKQRLGEGKTATSKHNLGMKTPRDCFNQVSMGPVWKRPGLSDSHIPCCINSVTFFGEDVP